jgi:hypothetical protein
MLGDYQRTLQELDKVDVFELNNTSIWRIHGGVEYMLDDYQGALEDLDKVNVLEPKNVIT